MADDLPPIPIHETYRGVAIFGLQSAVRITRAKAEIDWVIR